MNIKVVDYTKSLDVLIMNKTCNLSTVKNTPSEARRDAHTMYYYIDFCDNCDNDDAVTSVSFSSIVQSIYDVLEDRNLLFMSELYICAYMSDGTNRKILRVIIDEKNRSLTIKRIRDEVF